jgi:hypothetical protein
MGCLTDFAKIIKALRLKRCKSSCCNVEFEGSTSSPPVSPANTLPKPEKTEALV